MNHPDPGRAAVYEGTEPLLAVDIGEIVYYLASLPEHVNINTLEVMSIDQSWGPFAVHHGGEQLKNQS